LRLSCTGLPHTGAAKIVPQGCCAPPGFFSRPTNRIQQLLQKILSKPGEGKNSISAK